MNSPAPASSAADRSSAEAASQTGEPARKTWRVGTLVYTTPAVVALFAWLLLGDFVLWQLGRGKRQPAVRSDLIRGYLAEVDRRGVAQPKLARH
ncbi:MAG: hypothetical protein WC661_11720 [Opitutaceae bacterium]|jgi:hypothetical protein